MIKCIIVDDEKPARDELSYLISKDYRFDIVESYDNGKKLLEAVKSLDFDVLFIDINMPIMNGIQVVEALVEHGVACHVVFVTAYDDHAIKAFELNAVDYLLKPVSDERLQASLDRIVQHVDELNYENKIGQLLLQLNKDKKEHVCFHKNGKIVPVKFEDIIYVKAENKGAMVKTRNDEYISSSTLQEFEKKLFDGNFFRCHRSYLINVSFITHIEPWFNRTYQVDLEGIEEKIPISRNYVQNFKDLMNII
ncbi:response regulator transcription factor [Acidaminobacter sp. JC074]|uniref:LytR/AlgR family response regulator transcription factor n=1 Tax=Acidaminobacter sp. JC074 TaxID=2530199 RepID=UPI001F115387|nr:LytTR family DNA-binding domain-containing protein [Acidaminobacter sp. JC074]MCH4889101.1 response regulator transcription factor [Acidaminobacter sp. JC074]